MSIHYKFLIYAMLLWGIESVSAEDFFSTWVSADQAAYGCGRAKNVGLANDFATRFAQQPSSSVATCRRNALGINAAKRLPGTSAGTPGVDFGGGKNGYRPFSSTRTSRIARTAEMSAPFSTNDWGFSTVRSAKLFSDMDAGAGDVFDEMSSIDHSNKFLRIKRPGSDPVGEVPPQAPVGDAVISLLFFAAGYCLFKRTRLKRNKNYELIL